MYWHDGCKLYEKKNIIIHVFEMLHVALIMHVTQGWKYWFRRIYRYLDLTDISDISVISEIYRWIFLHGYRYIGN